MTDALIKRLRSQEAVDAKPYEIEQLTDEAADLIEQQSAKIAELEAQISAFTGGVGGWKLVPIEPTEGMVIRANEVEFCEQGITRGQLRAAIEAAPAAPVAPAVDAQPVAQLDMSLEARLADVEADVARLHKEKMDLWMQVHGYGDAQPVACLICNSTGNATPCAYPTEINRQQAERIERLRKGLFEARDAMRVMSGWVKKSDPAGHSWAVRMVDRANDILNHAPTTSASPQSEGWRKDALYALRAAEDALSRCYDVTEWPCSGETAQDAALATVRAALAKQQEG